MRVFSAFRLWVLLGLQGLYSVDTELSIDVLGREVDSTCSGTEDLWSYNWRDTIKPFIINTSYMGRQSAFLFFFWLPTCA